jgi:hypothetical protein
MPERRVVFEGTDDMARLARLSRDAVARMSIDLSDIQVLTEAATGPFAATAVIASLAGASEVVAVTRDSKWGKANDAISAVRSLAEFTGVADRIRFFQGSSRDVANGCDLVTNLGFVRPIDRALIEILGPTSAVALMWEPWEFREGEVDLVASRECGVPVVATAETHPEVRTFEYLGPTVGRLLLNDGIELVRSRVLVLGSEPFGGAVAEWLAAAGAIVSRANVDNWASLVIDALRPFDALIIVEHRDHRTIIAARHEVALDKLRQSGSPVVRLAGEIDRQALRSHRVTLLPDVDVSRGFMAVTTAHAGARPVVDLHAAGLKAASIAVRARRAGASRDAAIAEAVASGYGLALKEEK